MTYLNSLNPSVKAELLRHIEDYINEGTINNENIEDWHFHLFNEDYYIITYFQASEWLKKHGIDAFEAINICQEWEEDNLGELTKKYNNAETTVNMLVYVLGDEILNDINAENIDELFQAVTNY